MRTDTALSAGILLAMRLPAQGRRQRYEDPAAGDARA